MILSKWYAFLRIFISCQIFFSWLIKRVCEEEKDEFEDKDKQLSSNYGANMEVGRDLEWEQEREESEQINIIAIGIEGMLENVDIKKLINKQTNKTHHFWSNKDVNEMDQYLAWKIYQSK